MGSLRKRGEEIRQFILENISSHPVDIATFAAEYFQITRPAVNKHVKSLIRQGVLSLEGKTDGRRYSLAQPVTSEFGYPLDGNLKEDVVWSRDISPLFSELPGNVRRIWQYGVTGMLNNAIDHSGGTTVSIRVNKTAVISEVMILDDGVGIFKKIARELNLDDERDVVLELAKGKVATDPEHHTGERIFLTSRVFDFFLISSYQVVFLHEFKDLRDWIGKKLDNRIEGTGVVLQMKNNSARTIKQVLDKFQTGDLGFTKTVVPVWLAHHGSDHLISRSQAKRLLAGIEKFQAVVFDFANVDFIGQGFADEVFRVFVKRYPQIEIEIINADEEIRNMIRRALLGVQTEAKGD